MTDEHHTDWRQLRGGPLDPGTEVGSRLRAELIEAYAQRVDSLAELKLAEQQPYECVSCGFPMTRAEGLVSDFHTDCRRRDRWQLYGWALVVGLVAFGLLLALTACDTGQLVCHTEHATDGGADLEVCQRFPAPIGTP